MTFNAAAARAKRPCPLWVDAFIRDTQHLAADEVGAYMLILMAMWSRESCDYPDDDHRLARVCRVSLRLWKSRIGPALRPFFQTAGGGIISKRLRKEAAYVERQCKAQSDRKAGENSDKPLENHNTAPTADNPRLNPEPSGDHPSQQPNILGGGGGSAREPRADDPTPHEQILATIGVVDVTAKWHSPEAIAATDRWLAALSLTEILAEVEAIMRSRTGPPGSLRYFDGAMERALGRKANPPAALQPVPSTEGPANVRRASPRNHSVEATEAFLAGARRLG